MDDFGTNDDSIGGLNGPSIRKCTWSDTVTKFEFAAIEETFNAVTLVRAKNCGDCEEDGEPKVTKNDSVTFSIGGRVSYAANRRLVSDIFTFHEIGRFIEPRSVFT